MKNIFLLFFVLLSGELTAQSRSEYIRREIKDNLETTVINSGCRIVVEFTAKEGMIACRIPVRTPANTLVCSIATLLNEGGPVQDLGVQGCEVAYTFSKSAIRLTFDFAKGKIDEVAKVLTYFEENLKATYIEYTLKNP